MNRMLATSAAFALMLGVSSTAFAAMSAEDCNALFQKADLNKDSSLQADEAKLFLDAMAQAQVQPKDASMVTQDEFRTACEKDAFANIDPATIGTGQAATTTEQPATTEQTQTTAEQPAATTEQTQTTAEQPATTDQTQTTAEQPAATTEQTASTDPAAAPEEKALAIPEGIMASDLIGTNIYSTNNESIAEIKDVLFSQEGQATHVIVDAGDNDVAVELSQLKVAATDNGLKVIMNASQADLATLPPITTK